MNYGQYANTTVQQQQLPYDPQRIMVQPLPVSLGNPPFIPMVNVPAPMQQFLPLIASVAILEIQSKAQQNPLRTFMFNQYVQNNYNNVEFAELVEISGNYIHLVLMAGRDYNDPQQAIMAIVPQIVTMLAGSVLRFFPAIAGYLDQSQMQGATNGIRAMESVVADIVRSTQGQHQQPVMQPTPYGGAMMPVGYGHPQPMMMQPRFSSGNSGYGAPGPTAYGGGRPGLAPGNSGLFSGPASTYTSDVQLAPTSTGGGAAGRYNKQLATLQGAPAPAPVYPGAAPAPTMQRHQQAPEQPAVISEVRRGTVQFNPNTDSVVNKTMTNMATPAVAALAAAPVVPSYPEREYDLYELGQVVWKRSAQQPYHPAWNALTQKLYYIVQDDGTVLAVVQDKTPGEIAMMEYDKHAIGLVPTAPSLIKPEVQGEAPVINQEIVPADIKLQVKEGIGFEACEPAAAIYSNLEARVGRKVTNRSEAYCVRMCLCEPVYCETKDVAVRLREVLDQMSKTPTFTAAREIMADLRSPEELLLRNRLNEILTKEVNSVMVMNLSLVGVSIDDFMADTADLDSALRRLYGDTVATTLKDQEATILSSCINSMDEQSAIGFAEGLISDIEGAKDWQGELVFIPSLISFTHVAYNAYEFNVAGLPEGPVMISETALPELYAIVSQLMNSREIKSAKYRQHYLVTADGVRFEVSRGFLNKESFLIRQAL